MYSNRKSTKAKTVYRQRPVYTFWCNFVNRQPPVYKNIRYISRESLFTFTPSRICRSSPPHRSVCRMIAYLVLCLSLLELCSAFSHSRHNKRVTSFSIYAESEPIAEGTVFEQPKIGTSIVDVIGRTPMIRLNSLATGVNANIFLKLESMEPCNSVKDRIG